MWYVDFDNENLVWGVFHEDTGFCKGTFCDRESAVWFCKELNRSRPVSLMGYE